MKKEKVLIECHSLLGDLVLMTPMIKELRRKKPDILIDVAIASAAEKELLSMMGENIINNYYFFRPDRMSKIEILKLIMTLRKNHYDYGIVSVNENEKLGSLFLKLVGCKKQIGERAEIKHSFLQYNCEIDNANIKHRVERNTNLLVGLGVEPEINGITLCIESDLKKRMIEQIGIENQLVVGICLGTGDFVWKDKKRGSITYNCKKWGYNNFLQLTSILSKQYKVIWIGGKKEKEELEKEKIDVLKEPAYSAVNMIGKTSIKESLALLDCCDVVVGGDTGMMHCAAALGKNTLCIIGGTDPEKIKPYSVNSEMVFLNLPCSPCYETVKAVFCENKDCLNKITVNMVYLKIVEILNKVGANDEKK